MSQKAWVQRLVLACAVSTALILIKPASVEASSIKIEKATSATWLDAATTATPTVPPDSQPAVITADMTPVPEPATLLLFGAGLFVLAAER
jgi:hypothetical protein